MTQLPKAFVPLRYYSPGMIASLGHTDAQVPQSMQVSGSMW